jgi:hypothetical protein
MYACLIAYCTYHTVALFVLLFVYTFDGSLSTRALQLIQIATLLVGYVIRQFTDAQFASMHEMSGRRYTDDAMMRVLVLIGACAGVD